MKVPNIEWLFSAGVMFSKEETRFTWPCDSTNRLILKDASLMLLLKISIKENC